MSQIDEIKNLVDIVDIVQEYVELEKKGRNYWGVCPFHDDSNPSMSVSPEKQMYNCFSCGKAGGVFKFVGDIEKLPFRDVLKKLGDKVGVAVKVGSSKPKYNENETKVIAAMNDAMDFYRLSLETEEGSFASDYAEKRGLNGIIREKFNIGYAPKNRLIRFLKERKGHDEAVLINGSLMNMAGNDFFQDRLMFGIANSNGDVVAMSGRALHNEDAKYINSAESVVFKKNNILYNWNNAREVARRNNEVIVVEGFMDVIALYKAGIENVVAIMGTAFTKENISKVSDLSVTLMLDSDNAGISATIKSIKLLLENKINTKVIVNEGGKDADELLVSEGKAGIIKVVNNKITALEFIYGIHKKKYSNTSADEVEVFINSFKKYLKYGSDIEKDFFANKIKNEFGISENITLQGLKSEPRRVNEYIPREVNPTPVKAPSKMEVSFNKHSYTLIRSLIKSPKLIKYYEAHRAEVNYIDKTLITIGSYLIKAYNGEKVNLSEYKEYIDNTVKMDGDVVTTENEVSDLINRINETTKRYKRKQINVKLNDKDGPNG